jgi:hypothetical protein
VFGSGTETKVADPDPTRKLDVTGTVTGTVTVKVTVTVTVTVTGTFFHANDFKCVLDLGL